MKVFWEVDIQNDFMKSDGKLYVPNADDIIPNIKKIIQYAIKNKMVVLGSVDRHFDDDLELKIFPPHCMNKTDGQKVITEAYNPITLFMEHKTGERGKFNLLSFPQIVDYIKEIQDGGKLLFEKQTTDVFMNPHVGYVLEKLDVTEAIVYGVATDYCIKEAVLGLLKRGIKVTVIADAIKGIDSKASRKAIDEMIEKGANFVLLSKVMP